MGRCSNNETAELIDQSYKHYLSSLENHLSNSSFMFGQRPSSSDFALYGQLTQLVGFDPTPRDIAIKISPRTMAWVNIMSDLSGLHDKGGIGEFFGVKNQNSDKSSSINYFQSNEYGWDELDNLPESLKDLFIEIGRVYIPCLISNAEAHKKGEDLWETKIDGSKWKQKTFPYQVKCLNWIKDEFNKLSDMDKNYVTDYLKGTGCNKILS